MTTVLIVDDESDLRVLLRFELEDAGYGVLEASGGEEALAVLQSEHPDVVLLDLRMPGVDGWQVLEELRADGRLPGMYVVVVSAHANPAGVDRALEMGATHYISKPFPIEALMALLPAP